METFWNWLTRSAWKMAVKMEREKVFVHDVVYQTLLQFVDFSVIQKIRRHFF